MSAKLSKEGPQKSPSQSGWIFAPLKGEFTEAKQYFVALAAAIGGFVAFQAFIANRPWRSEVGHLAGFYTARDRFPLADCARLAEWRHQRVFVKSAERDAAVVIETQVQGLER